MGSLLWNYHLPYKLACLCTKSVCVVSVRIKAQQNDRPPVPRFLLAGRVPSAAAATWSSAAGGPAAASRPRGGLQGCTTAFWFKRIVFNWISSGIQFTAQAPNPPCQLVKDLAQPKCDLQGGQGSPAHTGRWSTGPRNVATSMLMYFSLKSSWPRTESELGGTCLSKREINTLFTWCIFIFLSHSVTSAQTSSASKAVSCRRGAQKSCGEMGQAKPIPPAPFPPLVSQCNVTVYETTFRRETANNYVQFSLISNILPVPSLLHIVTLIAMVVPHLHSDLAPQSMATCLDQAKLVFSP